MAYFDHEDKYLLVASNWGRAKHADWLFNLRQQSRASIEVKGKLLHVQARESEGDEYDRLWQYVTQRHPQYLRYQQIASRRIPIVILEAAR
jgi:deazaflavin-dependent oxidoreductase (nitroreductase family)